jgi:hypothetical protein
MDLLSPGLDYLLGVEGLKPVITDYLIADAKTLHRAATETEICHKITPVINGHEDPNLDLYLIPGKADPRVAPSLVGYLLAEHRAGLVEARITHLLEILHSKLKIDLFILDGSPGLFESAATIRRLVQENEGVLIHVSSAMKADLIGALTMLSSPEITTKDHYATVFMINRSPSSLRKELKQITGPLSEKFEVLTLADSEKDSYTTDGAQDTADTMNQLTRIIIGQMNRH